MKKVFDITGQRFGRLIAVKPVGRNKGGNIKWECKCDCGNTKIILASSLRSGNTKSCGCLAKEIASISGNLRFIDITGQRFGRLIAVKPVGRNTGGNIKWECKCDCGNTKIILATSLKSGYTKSCGCLKRDRLVELREKRIERY